ncbi:hypothetical protein A4S06_02670 [Erysipelotrichaceae bacterium MTC7]|nr:hypothetical protein A4S06_02670 [Erysipelotrichaceae bacterium MTC7]
MRVRKTKTIQLELMSVMAKETGQAVDSFLLHKVRALWGILMECAFPLPLALKQRYNKNVFQNLREEIC